MSEDFERRNIRNFEFNLVRMDCKVPSILRDAQDNIWVYVNETFSDSDVEIFVQRSSIQIAKLLEPKIKLAFDRKEIVDREEFLFLGNLYQLCIIDHIDCGFNFDGMNFYLSRELAHKGKELFKDFYFLRANEFIATQKIHFERIVGISAKNIILCDLQGKWGVCTPTGIIKINWQAVLLPQKLFNYVLAHEHAHLIHLNHSGSFWHCLDRLIENGRHLDRELENYLVD